MIYVKAKLYCKLREHNLALKDTQEGILIDPRNLVIRQQSMNLHRETIGMMWHLRQYNHSLADLDNAIRIAPNNSFVLISQKDCKVGGGKGGKDGINEGCDDVQGLLVCRNVTGYDKGFVATQQIFGERNFSRIYYRRGDIYRKLGMYELALENFNRTLELANGYAPIYKKRAYVLRKLESLDSIVLIY
ncbi:hypothetical protein Glove_109g406 [Diversispora epigaea]|uniref:Uncharacterized protein n=1 Tax=Diversispora epigaea TaxID=1348612 RepID=A0A397J2P1_9GLOM|nr:hypothetical protein Glove_109g406 [Diversispora epigaea]